MKNTLRTVLTVLILALFMLFSCKQKNNNPYGYDENRDTIRPVLAITVPYATQQFHLNQYIHIVGTLMDLESRSSYGDKAGKLKSLYLNISVMGGVFGDSVVSVLFDKSPNVDGKEGYTINESKYITSVPYLGVNTCRFRAIATDYAGRVDSTLRFFEIINP